MLKRLSSALLFVVFASSVSAQQIVQVFDADISGHVTWTKNNVYVLNGFVFVGEGESLTIEAGTVVKGKPGQAENASALIVVRDGKIFANGTQENPIIFTAEADDPANLSDLPIDARGLWGGVILLGKAVINSATGEGQIEGIPSTEPRGAYGGTDDHDNSGVLTYCSIRYGGTNIGEGNEINGLTMAAVGDGTTIDYIEVFSNADDGYEWFGGTVNTKHLISAFNGDDAFDYDEGFRGKGQYWFAILSDEIGNRAAEQDGGTTPEDGQPYAIPVLYNSTYIGSGSFSDNLDNDLAMIFRDNAGGKYYNSVFTDFTDRAVKVEDLDSGEDSRRRLEAGDLILNDNIWWGFGAGGSFDKIVEQDFVRDHLAANNNRLVDPELTGISRSQDGGLDPRPSASGPAGSGAPAASDGFFDVVEYYGAFDPVSVPWPTHWSFLHQSGILGTVVSVSENFDNIVPAVVELDQNFPNPFNPSTSIRFSLSQSGHVRLTVYNMYGQEVEVLIDDYRETGTHTITWIATALTSGSYYYNMRVNGRSLTRKMTLLK